MTTTKSSLETMLSSALQDAAARSQAVTHVKNAKVFVDMLTDYIAEQIAAKIVPATTQDVPMTHAEHLVKSLQDEGLSYVDIMAAVQDLCTDAFHAMLPSLSPEDLLNGLEVTHAQQPLVLTLEPAGEIAEEDIVIGDDEDL